MTADTSVDTGTGLLPDIPETVTMAAPEVALPVDVPLELSGPSTTPSKADPVADNMTAPGGSAAPGELQWCHSK